MKIIVLLTALAVALGGFGAVAAQPAPPAAPAPRPVPVRPTPAAQPTPNPAPTPAAAGFQTSVVKVHPHDDQIESHGVGMALLFYAFAAASIIGALFVVTRRNLIAAVMGMVGSFLGIAAIYMMLYAHFLAVIQLLVYAGAIMVLFVFVIMILNRPEGEMVAPSGRVGQGIAVLATAYLVYRLGSLLIHVQIPNPAVALAAPAATADGHAWGSIKAVGTDLFGPGLFPFEAISILLLVAVVGAIAIARPTHERPDTTDNPNDPAVEGQSP